MPRKNFEGVFFKKKKIIYLFRDKKAHEIIFKNLQNTYILKQVKIVAEDLIRKSI